MLQSQSQGARLWAQEPLQRAQGLLRQGQELPVCAQPEGKTVKAGTEQGNPGTSTGGGTAASAEGLT